MQAPLLKAPLLSSTRMEPFGRETTKLASRCLSDFEGIRRTIQCVSGIGEPICRIREERALQAPCLALNPLASNPRFGFCIHKVHISFAMYALGDTPGVEGGIGTESI